MNNTQTPPQTGQRTEQMGVVVTNRSGEMAVTAMAAKAKAQVEARYVMAYNRPRSILQARSDILAACERPRFAKSARYKKPVGNTTIDGFSIRFAEEAIKAMKNISVESTTIYEDEHRRTVQISVTDLESNLTYGKEVTVEKTVERQTLREGQKPLSERINSYGKKVFLVQATEDDIANKVGSAESKIIRNCGLRLVPSDILEEAEQAIEDTLTKGGGDPKAETKNIVDSFATLNIGASELEKYLKHSLESVSPKELNALRGIYAAVKDGEASWADYVVDGAPRAKPTMGETTPKDRAKTPAAKPTMAAAEAKPAAAAAKPATPPATPPATGKTTTPAKPSVPLAVKPTAPKAAPAPTPAPEPQPAQPPKLSVVPPTEDDGDLGPQQAGESPEQGEQPPAEAPQKVEFISAFAVTQALAEKIVALGVSDENFDKWIVQTGRDVKFKENPEEACAALLTDARALGKLKNLWGA